MHDTVWFEIQGTTAVSIASSEFVTAADAQANALGMPDAERVFVQHPIQDATDAEMRVKTDAIVDKVIAALSQMEGSNT